MKPSLEAILLALAYELPLADHTGDVSEDIEEAFALASMYPPERDELEGHFDRAALEARGAKSLSELAIADPEAFGELVGVAEKALA